jgi:hypothetical protein
MHGIAGGRLTGKCMDVYWAQNVTAGRKCGGV